MIRVISTVVADEIRRNATSAENAAEMRAESMEYANEVRGFYDYDADPYDGEDMDFRDEDPDSDVCPCGASMDGDECSDPLCASHN